MEEYFGRLAKRANGFRCLFENVGDRPFIVETGCLRKANNWEGDGQSTFLFDRIAEIRDGVVFSVDIEIDSVRIARAFCGPRTQIMLGDSVNFLKALAKTAAQIDLLYLDSLDLDERNPMPSAEHHLRELEAAMPMLHPGALVCVDDYGVADGGKGRLVNERLADMPVLYGGYQKIWRIA